MRYYWYTDGSCPYNKSAYGNPAGWGSVLLSEPPLDGYGPVGCGLPFHVIGSNNIAELQATTLHSTTLQLHYTTLNYTTLHYILSTYLPLHYTTLHCTTLHYIPLHYTTLPSTTPATFHYTPLPTPLHSTPLHSTTLHYTTLRHSGVHFFDISTSKSGPKLVCFVHFHFELCFAPQQRALFRHLNFQKWSKAGVLCTFSLRTVLRATTACNFSSLILASWLRTRRFSEPTFRPSGAHKSLEKHSESRLSYLFAHLHLLSSYFFSVYSSLF